MANYKPTNYNSLSPYFIVDDAQKLVEQLSTIFDAKTLRRYDRKDGSIMHIALLVDDSVIMISNSTEEYHAHTMMLHIYVQNVQETFKKAIDNGCKEIEKPINKGDDPDTRGSFYDCAGNYWSVSTQVIKYVVTGAGEAKS